MSKAPTKGISQVEFVRRYFLGRPNQEISHAESKKDLESSWHVLTGGRLEDSDRAIRTLFAEGFLSKVKKGVYKYDPATAGKMEFDDFAASDKERIFERDSYKCVVCGLGRENGLELHADHIKPRSLGGVASLENGQTLCSRHNFIKRNLSQTETGKKSFIRLLELVESMPEDPNSKGLEGFLREVLAVYEKHGIDGHIRWSSQHPVHKIES